MVVPPEVVDAAKAGNVDHVIALLKDVGRLHHLWQPNPAQAAAIENAAESVLRKASADAAGASGSPPPADGHVTDLQQDEATAAPVVDHVIAKRERLVKGYMVSSVNEWGADQTRILLITSSAVHRGKIVQTMSMCWDCPFRAILRHSSHVSRLMT